MHRSDRDTNIARTAKQDIRVKITAGDLKMVHETKKRLRENAINTVCETAKCPNLTECFSKSTATFIILGNACTRNCTFCAVDSRAPKPVDEGEPRKVARAAKRLNLKHVVITSVTRDDLPDKGVTQFIKTIRAIDDSSLDTTIEILTPDFYGVTDDILKGLVEKHPDSLVVFGHNMEMPKRLYPALRLKADYDRSLNLLKRVKSLGTNGLKVKSAIMLGLGEAEDEVKELISDIRSAGCDIIVIGQYLQPTLKHTPVQKYYSDNEFKHFEEFSYSLGFETVNSFPRARSSYYP